MLRGCTASLGRIEEDCDLPDIRVNLSKWDTSAGLNGLLTNTEITGMLEEKTYRNVDSVSPFMAAFIDKTTGFLKIPPMTRVHSK